MTPDDLYRCSYDEQRFNCAHFTVEAFRVLAGQDIAAALQGFLLPPGARYVPQRLRHSMQRLPSPVSPCIVLMLRHGRAPHVGMYYGGSVLELKRSGVSYLRPETATVGYDRVRFYRCLNAS